MENIQKRKETIIKLLITQTENKNQTKHNYYFIYKYVCQFIKYYFIILIANI